MGNPAARVSRDINLVYTGWSVAINEMQYYSLSRGPAHKQAFSGYKAKKQRTIINQIEIINNKTFRHVELF